MKKSKIRRAVALMLSLLVSAPSFLAPPLCANAAAPLMTAREFSDKCYDVATNYKTLYVMGCFGAPMNATNKQRYTQNSSFNMQADRTAKINAASADTFGFDCVCLIKGILWGWNGNPNAVYGGATYASNGVEDMTINTMLSYCTNVSSDFKDIEVGEILFCSKDANGIYGHVGIYIGNGLAVECTPSWKDCVQITAVSNIGDQAGYDGRSWLLHGKLTKFLEYCSCKDFDQNGVCTNCLRKFDYEAAKRPASGVYALTSDLNPSPVPFYSAKDENVLLKAGNTVTVVAECTNALDEEWCEITYGSQKNLFVSKASLKLVSDNLMPSFVSVKTTGKASLMSAPCNETFGSSVHEVSSLSKDTPLNVVSMVKGADGIYYYEAELTNTDARGWVACSDTVVTEYRNEGSDIISGEEIPTVLAAKKYTPKLTIRSLYSNIETVGFTLAVDGADNTIATESQTVGKPIFSLTDSDLRNSLRFEELSSGKRYTLDLSADLIYSYFDNGKQGIAQYTYTVNRQWTFDVAYSFVLPIVQGKFASEFSTTPSETSAPHYGVDLLTQRNVGETVYAAFAGTVYAVNCNCTHTGADSNCQHSDTFGNSVIIQSEDGSIYGIYGHLKWNSTMVSVGQQINAGAPIGTVGLSGNTEKSHLHFEVRRSPDDQGTAVNINSIDNGGFALYSAVGQKVLNSVYVKNGMYVISNDGFSICVANGKNSLLASDGMLDRSFEMELTKEDGKYIIKPVAADKELLFQCLFNKENSLPYVILTLR